MSSDAFVNSTRRRLLHWTTTYESYYCGLLWSVRNSLGKLLTLFEGVNINILVYDLFLNMSATSVNFGDNVLGCNILLDPANLLSKILEKLN